MPTVKAKFKVGSIEVFEGQKWVKMHVDTSSKSEDFSQYTPAGEMKMLIMDSTNAADFFVPGEVVTLTFSKD